MTPTRVSACAKLLLPVARHRASEIPGATMQGLVRHGLGSLRKVRRASIAQFNQQLFLRCILSVVGMLAGFGPWQHRTILQIVRQPTSTGFCYPSVKDRPSLLTLLIQSGLLAVDCA